MIINLTQHAATPEQISQGVRDLPPRQRKHLAELLTFDILPTHSYIKDRALAIARLAENNGLGADGNDDPLPNMAMIGGAPWLMPVLSNFLMQRGITPAYAFTKREVVETVNPDDSVTKTSQFVHVGFVY